jgi:putative serine/threonine protein kinase
LKEAIFLKKLNKYKIGPKLYYFDDNCVVMEKLNGDIIQNFDLKENKNKYIAISVLKQCFVMDKLGINKFEMTNPHKHLFVDGKKVTMIDFERCIYTNKPKNVTQFCEYLRRRGFQIDRNTLVEYKNKICQENFEKVVKMIKVS